MFAADRFVACGVLWCRGNREYPVAEEVEDWWNTLEERKRAEEEHHKL